MIHTSPEHEQADSWIGYWICKRPYWEYVLVRSFFFDFPKNLYI
nr:MAG TPA: hypothetical protein [Caudoviricetes sp.]